MHTHTYVHTYVRITNNCTFMMYVFTYSMYPEYYTLGPQLRSCAAGVKSDSYQRWRINNARNAFSHRYTHRDGERLHVTVLLPYTQTCLHTHMYVDTYSHKRDRQTHIRMYRQETAPVCMNALYCIVWSTPYIRYRKPHQPPHSDACSSHQV